jgi:signal transduction histidine kinase
MRSTLGPTQKPCPQWKVATTKGELGTGLGLGVVRSVVEEHRGRIEVESEPGVGATFHVWLPLMNGNAQGSAPV